MSTLTLHRPMLLVPLALFLLIFYFSFTTVLSTGIETPAVFAVVFSLVAVTVTCVFIGEE